MVSHFPKISGTDERYNDSLTVSLSLDCRKNNNVFHGELCKGISKIYLYLHLFLFKFLISMLSFQLMKTSMSYFTVLLSMT